MRYASRTAATTPLALGVAIAGLVLPRRPGCGAGTSDHLGAFVLAAIPMAREPDVAPDNNFQIVTETYADSVTFIVPVAARASAAMGPFAGS